MHLASGNPRPQLDDRLYSQFFKLAAALGFQFCGFFELRIIPKNQTTIVSIKKKRYINQNTSNMSMKIMVVNL